MTKFKKIVYIFALLICTFSISSTTYAKMELDDVRNGVVRITTNDGTDYYQGTGWAIGTEGEPVTYIVTNYHVIDGMKEIYLYRDEETMFVLTPTDIILKVNDIAVLQLEEPLSDLQPLIMDTLNKGKVGETIFTLGFPALADEIDSTYTGYPDDITVTSGIISKITSQSDDVEYYQIDAVINGGNSGGPLVNEEGYVIAINSFGLMGADGNSIGYNGSVLIDKLVFALQKNNITFTSTEDLEAVEAMSDGDNDEKQEDEKDPDNEDEENQDEEDEEDEDESAFSSMGIIIIAGIGISVILIILIIIIAVTSSKKKKTRTKLASNSSVQARPQPQLQPQKPVQAGGVPQIKQEVQAGAASPQIQQQVQPIVQLAQQNNVKPPRIVGINGYFANKAFDARSVVTFGRNPSATIAYPVDYKGISGNHCSVEFDLKNNLFILGDLGSTYGTFTVNGQKLNSNSKIALRNGERFYLADPQEMFEVRCP